MARSFAREEVLDDDTDLHLVDHAGDRERYLSSHRALAACTREFGRLAEDVGRRVGALRRDEDEALDLRITPGRCVAQLGSVALTLSWLRGTLDSVADGRLLVVAWRGKVAHGSSRAPEYGGPQSARSAVAIWEDVLVADATGESDWHWHAEGDETRRYDSAALAERCLEPLRAARETVA